MQIRNIHVQPHTVGEPKGRKLAAANASTGNAPATEGPVNGVTSSIDNTGALQSQLSSLPEVRADKVSEAASRLAAGEYNSSSAAAQTAAAILHQS
ncbi:MAG: flagellar biosynthesis anti-sigma factor FlgM [Fuerstiella sp.]